MIPGICDVIGETGQEQVAKAAAEQAVDEIPVLLKIGEAVEQIRIITVMAVSVGERLKFPMVFVQNIRECLDKNIFLTFIIAVIGHA